MMRLARLQWAVAMVTCLVGIAHAQMLSGVALINALRGGGHVIVMRHASSPRELPDKQTARPDNVTLERQLDEKGRSTATAMGDAMRRLKIPIGEVLSSPAFRARETARLAQLTSLRTVSELGEAGAGMQTVSPAQVEWLQKKVRELPRGTNTVLVTHIPNISGAFPEFASVVEGEAVVFGSDGKGGVRAVGRIRIEEWPALR